MTFNGTPGFLSADGCRLANLLQISSAFGRAMEAVDRAVMSAAVAATGDRTWSLDCPAPDQEADVSKPRERAREAGEI